MKKLLLMLVVMLSAFCMGQTTGHSVVLSCTASITPGVTYNFFRGTTIGGPYSQISLSPQSTCSFTDTAGLTAGVSYYYVATAFDAVTGDSSVFSNEVKATIPSPPAPPQTLRVISAK